MGDYELSDIPCTYGDLVDSVQHPAMLRALLHVVRDSAENRVRREVMLVLEMAVGDVDSLVEEADRSEANLDDALDQATDLYKKFIDAGAVPILTEVLSDPDDSIRRNAARVLGKLGDTCVVPPLTELIYDPEARVRREVALALGELGDIRAVPALIEALDDPEKDVRMWAASSLIQFEDARAITGLIKALRDPDSVTRRWAALALGKLRDSSAVLPLIEALKDPVKEVRQYAASALGDLADTRGVPTLIETLCNLERWGEQQADDSPDDQVDSATVTQLIQDLDSPNVDVRRSAAYWLGWASDSRAVPALMKAMWEKDWYVQPTVANSLIQQLKSRRGVTASAVGPLVRTLGSGDEYTHTQAATALNKLGGAGWVGCWSAIIVALVKIFLHPLLVRWANRGRLEDQRIIPALVEAMNDPEINVKSQSWDSLVRILSPLGGHDHVWALVQHTSDPDGYIRELAKSTLIRLGEPDSVPRGWMLPTTFLKMSIRRQ